VASFRYPHQAPFFWDSRGERLWTQEEAKERFYFPSVAEMGSWRPGTPLTVEEKKETEVQTFRPTAACGSVKPVPLSISVGHDQTI